MEKRWKMMEHRRFEGVSSLSTALSSAISLALTWQEAMVQEMIAANTEKRELRETLQAQLLEEQRRAKDFEAKYLELQVHEEKADRQFVDKLIRDKERWRWWLKATESLTEVEEVLYKLYIDTC